MPMGSHVEEEDRDFTEHKADRLAPRSRRQDGDRAQRERERPERRDGQRGRTALRGQPRSRTAATSSSSPRRPRDLRGGRPELARDGTARAGQDLDVLLAGLAAYDAHLQAQ